MYPPINHNLDMSAPALQNYARRIFEVFMGPVNIDTTGFSTVFFGCVLLVFFIYIITYVVALNNLQQSECTRANKMYPSVNGYIRSLPKKFYDRPLRDFYIFTAYNACSGGEYRNDYVDTCHLSAVISQGVRAFDLEIYSIRDQPVVATSTDIKNLHVKETYNSLSLANAIRVIKNGCFSGQYCPNPADPVILHLRVKSTNDKMFANMVHIFRDPEFIDYFLNPEFSYDGQNIKELEKDQYHTGIGNGVGAWDMPVRNFLGKILTIFDITQSQSFSDNPALMEFVNMKSGTPEFHIKTNYDVSSTTDTDELTEYNRNYVTIVTPDIGTSPDNPNGSFARSLGCQMVASRFQSADSNLRQEIEFFQDSNQGLVCKPDVLCSVKPPSTTTNTPASLGTCKYTPKTIQITPKWSIEV